MEQNLQETRKLEQRRILIAINFFLVSVMLSCFAFMFGKFIEAIFPTWRFALFPWLAFIIAIESLVLRYVQYTQPSFSENKNLKVISELIIIFLVIKLFSMMLDGFSLVWQEIVSWQHNFLENFFDGDYLLRAFGLLLVWMLTWLFSFPLHKLDIDESSLAQERVSFTYTDRQELRRQLISLTFTLGFFIIVMMVVIKSNVELLPFNPTPSRILVTYLMIYFFAGFTFIALNQYAIMKARWFFNHIAVDSNLAQRWLLFTLTFILLVVLVIIFIPTNFTFGFYSIAQFLSQVFIFLFEIIQFLIFLPVALALTLISALFPNKVGKETPQDNIPEMIPTLPKMTGDLQWLEILKSVFFWLVFVGVIFFSIRYYLHNRQDLASFFKNIKLRNWIKEIFQWIKQGFKSIGQATLETIQKGAEKVKNFLKDQAVQLPALSELTRRLPPRYAIIINYIGWIQWNQAHGIPRKESQTPLEYAITYDQKLPEGHELIEELTSSFIKARYSRQNVSKIDAQEFQKLLADIKHLHQQKEQVESSNP